MTKGIKYYIFEKLFLPKVVAIDNPGIIINQLSKRYGSKSSKKRTIYYFEDNLSDLFVETTKIIGQEKTRALMYKIGKEMGSRYMMLSGATQIKESMLPIILEYIFSNLSANGMSVCENVNFDQKKKRLILSGKDSIIWRKVYDGSVYAGLVSGIFSFLLGRNIEAIDLTEGEEFMIIADEDFPEKYVIDFEKFKPTENYLKVNFPSVENKFQNVQSNKDFIKFKKIYFDKSGKEYLLDNVISSGEIGMLDIVAKNYEEINMLDMMKESIIKSSEKISMNIFKEDNLKSNIKYLRNIFSALGWGIIDLKIKDNNINLYFMYPPVSKYDFLYLPLVLNGFLNNMLNKDLKISKIDMKNSPKIISISFSEI